MDGDSPGGECPPPAIPEAEISKLSEFQATLAQLRAEAPVLPLEDLVERTARDFDYDLAAVSLPGGARRLANIRKLMRLARGYEEAEGRDLPGFLEFLAGRASSRDGRPEGQAATQAEAYDGVRIMTVHAAKGLEFPVVAVADLGRRLSGRPPEVLIGRRAQDEGRTGIQLARIAASGERLFDYEELKDAAAQDEVAEEYRLAYVAASRARDRLILSGCLQDGWDRKDVEERAAGRPIVQRLLEARAQAPPGMEIVENDPARFAELTAAAPVAAQATKIEPLAAALVATPAPAPEEAPFEAGEELAFGVAVHALLEACANEGWKAPAPEGVVAALRAEGITDEGEAERAAQLLAGFLASPLCEELRRATRVHTEIPFLLPVAGRVERGRMDLLAEFDGGGRLVVDYKTDRLGGDPAELMAPYEDKRRLYALAAAGGGGTPVRTAYVFLARPEKPVEMEFGEAELAEAMERTLRSRLVLPP